MPPQPIRSNIPPPAIAVHFLILDSVIIILQKSQAIERPIPSGPKFELATIRS